MANKNPESTENIIASSLEDVLHNSMMPYAEYVILERALPRVEDGLKPVQRRILYTMLELGLSPDKPHRKCARIVGDCLGKYHPHGDTSVYDATVRMAQPFSLRATLVDGHGNFGSVDGDGAAAMRYTEARMTPLALEMLRDIQKDTVPFRLNFDDTLKEPDVLPARYPNLLVNGASGIAVGLATNIPTHNLRETVKATLLLMDNPSATLDDLMTVLPAPDFPTGGLLLDAPEIREAYDTGRAKLTLRAKVHVEQGKAGRTLLCITEIPYQVNKALMLERILKVSEEKKAALGCIYDIRDESDRTGMRAVVELKRDADPHLVLGYLYKYTDMQITFAVNMVAIADGKPRQIGLKPMLQYYINHQKDVVTKRTQFDLDQALARAHILEGLIVAVDNLDEVLTLIRASKNGKEAKARLMERFSFTDIQAQAILDLRLQRLTGLEVLELRHEFEEINKLISKLEGILKSEKRLLKVIRDELQEIADKYGDDRRTQIIKDNPAFKEAVAQNEVPVPEETVVILTHSGQLRRVNPRTFEKLDPADDAADMPKWQFRALTDHTLVFFTNTGNCFRLGVDQIEENNRPKDRGISLAGVLAGLDKGERVVALFCSHADDLSAMPDILFFTQNGYVKRTEASLYDVRRSRFAAIKLENGDELIQVLINDADKDCFCLSRTGMLIRFTLSDVPNMGRVTKGVVGMKLGRGDAVRWAGQLSGTDQLILFTEHGYGKRIMGSIVDTQHRGGKGVRSFNFGKSGGQIGAFTAFHESRNFSVLQKRGELTTMHTDEIIAQSLSDKGKPYVLAILDNTVVSIVL